MTTSVEAHSDKNPGEESSIHKDRIANLKSTQTKPEVLLPVMSSMHSLSSPFLSDQTYSQILDQESPYGDNWEDQEDGLGFDHEDPYGLIGEDQDDYQVGLGFE
eukprot:TRINITY_DN11871_c0_g1_i1.p1 TRINITY_DN11871_c0_g1~~TRINITY_DN11871_c0_g1_i1.p1  ORF type:complete len:104 (+),score=27.68 TRINITY_DN11871_c0_g1_i1:336-647(+)